MVKVFYLSYVFGFFLSLLVHIWHQFSFVIRPASSGYTFNQANKTNTCFTLGPQREKMYLRAIFEQKKNNVTLNVQCF